MSRESTVSKEQKQHAQIVSLPRNSKHRNSNINIQNNEMKSNFMKGTL